MKVSHLNALRALEATLRLGSFTKAADELGVTSAAVGQQVRSLEARLVTELFDRSNTTAEPTPTALRVRERLTLHMSGLADVLAALGDTDASRLSITLPASFAENWFARRIPEFWQAHPELDLRLNATNRMVDLRREDFDFALRFCGLPAAEFEALELFGDFVVPVCTPDFGHRFGLSISSTALDGVPLVHLDDRTPDPTWVDWTRWAQTFSFTLPDRGEALRYHEVSSGLGAARLEQGLVLAGVVEAHDALISGELIAPFGVVRNCPTEFRYRLVWPAATRRSAVQREFVEWISQAAEQFRSSLDRIMRAAGPE